MRLAQIIRSLFLIVVVLFTHDVVIASPQKKKHQPKKQEKRTEQKHKVKIGPEPLPEPVKTDKKPAEEKLGGGACNCVFMKIQAQDTISNDAYITYIFTVKNRCKEPVWINSGKFGFVVNNFNGSRARVIRDLLFVKRAIYPPFVSIKPGSDFEFKFADNPFDEYQLKRGNRYWFRFIYNNPNLRHPSGKNLNYTCRKELQRLVYIR
ncbi:MAG: hypothetical protein JSS82_09070 [Bacteroidetes bacterium]|nr:hypothetical protein [Bacteroidota bacterium]